MILIPKPGYVRRFLATRARVREVTLQSIDEIAAVMAHYDLGHWQVCDALSGGNSNNVAIQTSRGKKVLKRYYWSLPSTQQEHSILRHLAATNFPSPRLVINKGGSTYTELGDKHYAIYDFVAGYRYTNFFMLPQTRQQLVAQAGKTLALFHQLMAGFVLEGRKLNGFRPDGKRLWRDVAWHLNTVEQYVEETAKKKSLDAQDMFLLNIVDELKRNLLEVGRHYEPTSPQLPQAVIHADYSPQNIMIDRQGIATVLDFGDACVNLRALDVARGVTSFSNMGRDGLDQALARNFLLAYQAQQPLHDEEIAAVPDLIRWRLLRNIIWVLPTLESNSRRKARDKHLESLRRKWDENCWMKAYSGQMREFLLSSVSKN